MSNKTIEQQWTELDERREALAAEMGFAYVDSVDGKKLEIEALQDRDRIAREEERDRINKLMAMNIPQKTVKKTEAYNDGMISGWYAAREFIRQALTTPPEKTEMSRHTKMSSSTINRILSKTKTFGGNLEDKE